MSVNICIFMMCSSSVLAASEPRLARALVMTSSTCSTPTTTSPASASLTRLRSRGEMSSPGL